MDTFTASDGRFPITFTAWTHETLIHNLRSRCINRQTKATENNPLPAISGPLQTIETDNNKQQTASTVDIIRHKQTVPSAPSATNQVPRRSLGQSGPTQYHKPINHRHFHGLSTISPSSPPSIRHHWLAHHGIALDSVDSGEIQSDPVSLLACSIALNPLQCGPFRQR
jgi:hypothetical protein